PSRPPPPPPDPQLQSPGLPRRHPGAASQGPADDRPKHRVGPPQPLGRIREAPHRVQGAAAGRREPCYNEGMRYGVIVCGARDAPSSARALLALGFECFEIEFWENIGRVDLAGLADSFAALREAGASVSALGVYGNTLDPDGATLASLRALVRAAGSFGAPIVSCFAGRVPGKSVPDSLESWKAAFGDLADEAAALGLSLALENCRLGDTWKTGKWNIAINPDAWELLFGALPGAPIGLEWEPAHQILALADPEAQLAAWVDRVIHVHGKDARIVRGAEDRARVSAGRGRR